MNQNNTPQTPGKPSILRRKLWIQPEFQGRMIRQWALAVIVTIFVTQLFTMAFAWYQDRHSGGTYFFVSTQSEDMPIIINPTSVNIVHIILPAVLTALAFGICLALLGGLYYSHRMAGPIFRIRRTLREVREGKAVTPIILRKYDEFKELADDINYLLTHRAGSEGTPPSS